jgi:nucleoside-diphosphate kinase
LERTLIIFKPDAVMRGFVGEILARFERVGLKIIGVKMLRPDYNHYFKHYEGIGTLKTRKGEEIFESTMLSMQDGPVIAMVLEGVDSVELVRKMVGGTEPKTAQPGTIRGDYAHFFHASADKNEAEKEIDHWFSESELYSYEAVHEMFTQPRKK